MLLINTSEDLTKYMLLTLFCFLTEKDEKRYENALTDEFDTVCKVPICWMKYKTTAFELENPPYFSETVRFKK